MNAVIEINGAFSEPSRISAPDLAARFIQIPPNGRCDRTLSAPGRRQETYDLRAAEVNLAAAQTCETPSGKPKAMMEAVGFSLAVLVVIGLGTLGGWAVTSRWWFKTALFFTAELTGATGH
jgi:hypothetical protein